MQREAKIKLLFLVISVVIFSCDIDYPDIKEIDYVLNYYFNPDNLDYLMDFDFAVKVLRAEEITKIIIENRNTREFIEINTQNSNYSVFSVLGKNIFYYKELKFNFFSNTFNSFIADIRLFDAGMREYNKSFVINVNLSKQELEGMHKIIYKDKDIDALGKLGNVKIILFKVSKDDERSSNTKEISDLKNIDLDNEMDNFLHIYYTGKNANLFFKLR